MVVGRNQYGKMLGAGGGGLGPGGVQILPSIQAISKDWDGQDVQMDGSHTHLRSVSLFSQSENVVLSSLLTWSLFDTYRAHPVILILAG